jgi:hypothetical protein
MRLACYGGKGCVKGGMKVVEVLFHVLGGRRKRRSNNGLGGGWVALTWRLLVGAGFVVLMQRRSPTSGW